MHSVSKLIKGITRDTKLFGQRLANKNSASTCIYLLPRLAAISRVLEEEDNRSAAASPVGSQFSRISSWLWCARRRRHACQQPHYPSDPRKPCTLPSLDRDDRVLIATLITPTARRKMDWERETELLTNQEGSSRSVHAGVISPTSITGRVWRGCCSLARCWMRNRDNRSVCRVDRLTPGSAARIVSLRSNRFNIEF